MAELREGDEPGAGFEQEDDDLAGLDEFGRDDGGDAGVEAAGCVGGVAAGWLGWGLVFWGRGGDHRGWPVPDGVSESGGLVAGVAVDDFGSWHSDHRQIAVIACQIESVADDEAVGDVEADVFGGDVLGGIGGFAEEDAGFEGGGIEGSDVVLGHGDGLA